MLVFHTTMMPRFDARTGLMEKQHLGRRFFVQQVGPAQGAPLLYSWGAGDPFSSCRRAACPGGRGVEAGERVCERRGVVWLCSLRRAAERRGAPDGQPAGHGDPRLRGAVQQVRGGRGVCVCVCLGDGDDGAGDGGGGRFQPALSPRTRAAERMRPGCACAPNPARCGEGRQARRALPSLARSFPSPLVFSGLPTGRRTWWTPCTRDPRWDSRWPTSCSTTCTRWVRPLHGAL